MLAVRRTRPGAVRAPMSVRRPRRGSKRTVAGPELLGRRVPGQTTGARTGTDNSEVARLSCHVARWRPASRLSGTQRPDPLAGMGVADQYLAVTPDELLAAQVARGSIRLVPRSEAERAAYLRAIHALINSALVPAGQMVRTAVGTPVGCGSGCPVPGPCKERCSDLIADSADPGDAVIAGLLSQPAERLRVSTGQRDRALALVQALVNAGPRPTPR